MKCWERYIQWKLILGSRTFVSFNTDSIKVCFADDVIFFRFLMLTEEANVDVRRSGHWAGTKWTSIPIGCPWCHEGSGNSLHKMRLPIHHIATLAPQNIRLVCLIVQLQLQRIGNIRFELVGVFETPSFDDCSAKVQTEEQAWTRTSIQTWHLNIDALLSAHPINNDLNPWDPWYLRNEVLTSMWEAIKTDPLIMPSNQTI